jgi:hypothetical protein
MRLKAKMRGVHQYWIDGSRDLGVDARLTIMIPCESADDAIETLCKSEDVILETGEQVAIAELAALRSEVRRLKWGIVANAGHRAPDSKPRWSHVKDATGFGSTSAQQLCRDAGFDPDEMVGGDRCEWCPYHQESDEEEEE